MCIISITQPTTTTSPSTLTYTHTLVLNSQAGEYACPAPREWIIYRRPFAACQRLRGMKWYLWIPLGKSGEDRGRDRIRGGDGGRRGEATKTHICMFTYIHVCVCTYRASGWWLVGKETGWGGGGWEKKKMYPTDNSQAHRQNLQSSWCWVQRRAFQKYKDCELNLLKLCKWKGLEDRHPRQCMKWNAKSLCLTVHPRFFSHKRSLTREPRAQHTNWHTSLIQACYQVD